MNRITFAKLLNTKRLQAAYHNPRQSGPRRKPSARIVLAEVAIMFVLAALYEYWPTLAIALCTRHENQALLIACLKTLIP